MLYSSWYSFLTALLRDELRRYEMKKSTQLRGFHSFAIPMRFNETS